MTTQFEKRQDLFVLCSEGLQTGLNLFLQVNLFCTGAPAVNSINAIDHVNLLLGNSFIPNLPPWVSNLLETLGTRLFHTQECAFVLTMSVKDCPHCLRKYVNETNYTEIDLSCFPGNTCKRLRLICPPHNAKPAASRKGA